LLFPFSVEPTIDHWHVVAIALSKLGHHVVLCDLSSRLLDKAREQAAKEKVELKGVVHCDVLELGQSKELQGKQFDIVLCLGPLYHLLEEGDRDKALENCLTLAKPRCHVVASFVSVFAHLRDLARKDPARLLAEWPFYSKYLDSGKYTRRTDNHSYHALPEEVLDLSIVEDGKASLEKVVSAEGFLGFDGARALAKLSDQEFNKWLDVVMETAANHEMLGSADHILAIFKNLKKQSTSQAWD
jgi:S-adenosylmethionine-dependent methyltransferase